MFDVSRTYEYEDSVELQVVENQRIQAIFYIDKSEWPDLKAKIDEWFSFNEKE